VFIEILSTTDFTLFTLNFNLDEHTDFQTKQLMVRKYFRQFNLTIVL
jgi:hypothetical protein